MGNRSGRRAGGFVLAAERDNKMTFDLTSFLLGMGAAGFIIALVAATVEAYRKSRQDDEHDEAETRKP